MRKIAREFGISLSSVHRIVTGETAKTPKSKVSKSRDKEERKKKIAELEKKDCSAGEKDSGDRGKQKVVGKDEAFYHIYSWPGEQQPGN